MSSISRKYAQHCNETYPAQIQNELFYVPGPEPTSKIAIVTCMDARLDVFKMFGLKLGEAHVIRVGGGRTPDALRSLITSEHILETKEIMVVHHTDCGFMRASTDDEAHTHIQEALQKCNGDANISTRHLPIQVIPGGDLNRSIREDIQFLRTSPYIRKDAMITGWIYDTPKGTMQEVGTEAGKQGITGRAETRVEAATVMAPETIPMGKGSSFGKSSSVGKTSSTGKTTSAGKTNSGGKISSADKTSSATDML